MKSYEKDLRRLIHLSNGGCTPVMQEDTNMTEEQLMFLAAKGFISLGPAGDDEYWITVDPPGLVHFSNKIEKRENFVKEHLATFLVGFVSGVLVTVVSNWLLQLMP